MNSYQLPIPGLGAPPTIPVDLGFGKRRPKSQETRIKALENSILDIELEVLVLKDRVKQLEEAFYE
jgi:hypothetical protein